MIERIIENWLINSTERTYQIPFCQVLGLKGYTILHLSSHGVTEHGKDIIALDDKNVPCAFQLKTGAITASVWRRIHGEITELVELPPDYPCMDPSARHRAILITNGKITDDVRNKIVVLNRGYRNRGLPNLEVINGKELLQEFIQAQGTFLPRDPGKMHSFLELYCSDGRTNIEERRFANFIEGMLLGEETNEKDIVLSRRIASGLLLTKYSLSPYERVSNHVSMAKGWVLYCAYLLALVEKTSLSSKYWRSSYQLCWREIDRCLQRLKEEVFQRNNRFLEGDITGDGGEVYAARVTIILGWLSAHELLQQQRDSSYELDRNVYTLVRDNFPHHLALWGESAVIHFIMMALFLSRIGETDMAVAIYRAALSAVVKSNNFKSRMGLPDPYYSPDDILDVLFGPDDPQKIDFGSFVGTAYTLKTLVDCLVRENRRDVLEELWYSISHMQYCEYIPEPDWHTYFWRSQEGTEFRKAFDSPQSWDRLRREAFLKPYHIPPKSTEDRQFLILFLLTFPHRVRSDLVKLIDHNFR